MKFVYFPFFFFFFSVFSAQNSDKKYWAKDSLLSWTDFKDTPKKKRVAALSYCGIQFRNCDYKYGQTPKYKFISFFQRNLSWVWENTKLNYVLKHEQLHFDITELFARKMRKYFSESEIDIEDSKDIYKQIFDQYGIFQDQYDKDTQHGTLDKEQAKWQLEIEKQLLSLEKYAEDKCY